MDDGTDHCITGVTDGASQDILARRTLIHHSVPSSHFLWTSCTSFQVQAKTVSGT